MPTIDPHRRLPPNPTLRGYRLPSLTYWRLRRQLTPPQLAERAGVSRLTIDRLERLPAVAKYKTIYRLAAALDLAPLVLTLAEPYAPPTRPPERPAARPLPRPPARPTPTSSLGYGYQLAIAHRDGLPPPPPPTHAPTDARWAPAPTGGKIINLSDAKIRRTWRQLHGPTYKQPW